MVIGGAIYAFVFLPVFSLGVWAWWWGLMVGQPSVLGAFTGATSVAS